MYFVLLKYQWKFCNLYIYSKTTKVIFWKAYYVHSYILFKNKLKQIIIFNNIKFSIIKTLLLYYITIIQ